MQSKIAPAPPGTKVNPALGWLPEAQSGVSFGPITDDSAGVPEPAPTVSTAEVVIGDDDAAPVVEPIEVDEQPEPELIDGVPTIEPEPAIKPIEDVPVIGYAVDRSRKIKLQSPILVDGRRLDVIALRPLTVGDIICWHAGEIDGPIAFISRLSGESSTVIEAIQYPDAGKLMDAFIASLPAFVAAELTGTAEG